MSEQLSVMLTLTHTRAHGAVSFLSTLSKQAVPLSGTQIGADVLRTTVTGTAGSEVPESQKRRSPEIRGPSGGHLCYTSSVLFRLGLFKHVRVWRSLCMVLG